MLKDPFAQFALWFAAAKRSKAVDDPTPVCLSTVDLRGFPDGRMVLLKSFDERGFVFFTNLHSVKGRSLKKNPRAALTFYWPPLKKQVRIQGKPEVVSDDEADAYWKTRARLSQLGAWASKQSEVLSSQSHLAAMVARLGRHYKSKPIPRPPFWTGIRVVPYKIEFWKGGANRLHDRMCFTKKGHRWTVVRLYP